MPSIALLDGPKDKVAKSIDVSWEQLVKALHAVEYTPCTPCPGHDCPHKFGRAWSPVAYVPGATKHVDHEIAAITFAVYDLDDPTPAQMAALATKLEGHAYLVHQTHRGNGYRLVLPLTAPVPAAQWRDVWRAIGNKFGIPLDETCLNESRIYFTPSRPEGTGFEVYDGVGHPLNWMELDTLFATPKDALQHFERAVQSDADKLTNPTDPANLRAGDVDLEEMRKAVAAMRRPESRQLLDTILSGRKLTENDPKDVGFRDTTLNRACSLLATAPQGKAYPVETVVALLTGSIRAMEVAPEGLDYWLNQAREKYLRALGRRLENDVRRDEDKAAILRVLGQEPGKLSEGSDDDWRRGLIYQLDAQGEPGGLRPVGANANLIMENAAGWKSCIRFNEITKEIDILPGCVLSGVPRASLDTEAANWLARSEFRLYLKSREVGEQLLAVARRHAYDPLIDWFNALPEWDGKPRVRSFFGTYFGAKGDAEHLQTISQAFLVSTVARAMQPGCEVHTVPVLVGEQGAGKSRSLRALGGLFFAPLSMNLGDKDSRMLAASNWIIELAELAAIRNVDLEKIKSFISDPFDKIRPPYGKVHEMFLRRCVFVGTTNEDEILTDYTGNRRWWPIVVTKGDVDGIARDRDQIFAEALALYRAGTQWHLTDAQSIKAAQIATGFQRPSARAEQVLAWFLMRAPHERPAEVTSFDLLNTVLGIPSAQISTAQTMDVGRAARELGFTKHRKHHAGQNIWVYRTPLAILQMAKDTKPVSLEVITQAKINEAKA